MKTFIKKLAIIILYFVGITAMIGGWGLVSDPSGKALNLPLSVLQNTPFPDFFYPGLILFLAIGMGSILNGSLVILEVKNYPTFIIGQGIVLTGWIIIQVLLLDLLNGFHLLYGTTGIILILGGIFLYEWNLYVKLTDRSFT